MVQFIPGQEQCPYSDIKLPQNVRWSVVKVFDATTGKYLRTEPGLSFDEAIAKTGRLFPNARRSRR